MHGMLVLVAGFAFVLFFLLVQTRKKMNIPLSKIN